ncbi:MAG: hypothetical protein L0Z48_10685 [candidate division Zixibacteria bacterium]|nr:hypothetical protein [candidate division Zixibacteria bacterium]
MKNPPAVVLIAAVLVLGALEGIALWRGVNGFYFATTVGAVCGLCGVTAGKLIWDKRVERQKAEE